MMDPLAALLSERPKKGEALLALERHALALGERLRRLLPSPMGWLLGLR